MFKSKNLNKLLFQEIHAIYIVLWSTQTAKSTEHVIGMEFKDDPIICRSIFPTSLQRRSLIFNRSE